MMNDIQDIYDIPKNKQITIDTTNQDLQSSAMDTFLAVQSGILSGIIGCF